MLTITFPAIGIAQQMGLHTKRPYSGKDSVFWKRIWWTLYVSSDLISQNVVYNHYPTNASSVPGARLFDFRSTW